MKRRIMSWLLVFAMVLGMFPGTALADGEATIPDGAPFTALTTNKGSVSADAIVEKGTITYSNYDAAPYYHVTIPAGATEVYVTHPDSEDPFAEYSSYSGAYEAYGYYSTLDGTAGGMLTFGYTEADDGVTVTLPLSVMVDTDGDWSPDTEGSFVADEDGTVSYAVCVERTAENSNSPICFFTFEYAVAAPGEHTHTYDDGVVTIPSTCVADGVKTYTCSGCDANTEGHTKTETVNALGHSYGEGVADPNSTCAAEGVMTYTCTVCDTETEGHTKTETIAKKAHTYDEGVQTKAPTCRENGVMTYTCSVCSAGTEGHTKEETIPKLTTHSFTDEDGKALETCSVCGTTNPDYVDPNMPQQDENGVYQIATAENLIAFAKFVNKGNKSVSAKLTADIDLTGKTWSGIGTSSNCFAGTFDGNGKTVTFDGHTAPLFLYAKGASNSNRAVIKNVTTAGSVNADAAIVGMAGDYTGGYVTIQNCVNAADVSRGKGGIVGEARQNVTIDQCANLGNITGSKSTTTGPGVGGIAGYAQNSVTISNCYNLGNITNTASEILVGGIVGNLYNDATVINCYNAGEVRYAIAGSIYNKTGTVSNSYYLSTKSTEVAPSNKLHEAVDATPKTVAEITDAAMATALGTAFQQSCPAPVFTWQTAAEHSLNANNECTVCGLGVKQTFNVTLGTGTGYTITGDPTVKEGDSYTFIVTISEGYEKGDNFTVTVGGIEVNSDTHSCTVENVAGPLSITVKGVSKIPDNFTVTLPGTGNGYRVTPCEGFSATSAERGKDYKFTVTFVDGFKAGENFKVKANGKELVNQNGVYTIENVMAAQTVTVEGVDAIRPKDTADVTFTFTYGVDKIFEHGGKVLADVTLQVPYFDLELYGLSKYYYNPYCYLDKNGNDVTPFAVGNRETAYGKVTALHAFIYATDLLYLELPAELAGTGYSYANGQFTEDVIKWTGGVGSSFMYLWGQGSNLNYYVNYVYPLGKPEIGSTADQVVLKDDDVISVHLIEDTVVSGSNFEFFVVNDKNTTFDGTAVDTVDAAAVKQGEEVTLTLYRSGHNGKYETTYSAMENKALYWTESYNFAKDVDNSWKRTKFAGLDTASLKTDANGRVTLNTADLAPGTYYIATVGDCTEGGEPDSTGYQPNGYETGPALFKLIVAAHTYGDPDITAATCTEDGSKTYTCTCCDTPHTYTETIPAGHTTVQVDAQAKTCTEAGWNAYEYCTACDYTTKVEIPATGHSWNAGVVTKEPTYSETGVKTYTCQNDQSHTKTESVAKLDPPVYVEPVAPSNPTVSGNTTTNPDGSTTKTEVKADGSVTQTTTSTDGTVAKTETKVDGSSQTTVSTKDGSKSTTSTTASGVTTSQVTVSAAAAAEAAKAEKPVALPMPEVVAADNTAAAPAVTINTGAAAPVTVEVPVANVTAGTVAVLVNADGTETIITDSIPTENGVAVEVANGATVKIVDNSTKFEDVSTKDWEKDAVDFVSARGIMNGTNTGVFSPDATTTRAQVWTMLARLSGVDTSKGESWYSAGQEWAKDNGVSDGTDPTGEITREQLATMLWRFMGEPASDQSLDHFDDHQETSEWALAAKQWAVENGIISGYDGKLDPTGGASRAQVAQMLMKLICNVK